MNLRKGLWTATFAAMLAACSGGSDGDSDSAPRNQAPSAAAGANQIVDEQVDVTLDGNASSDPDGSIASYRWSQVAGPLVTLDTPAASVTRFTSPPVGIVKTLTFELQVVDDGGASATDRVDVVVNPIPGLNLPPVADAGLNRTLSELGNVALDGTRSADPDGLIATFAWQQVSGRAVTLSNSTIATPFFAAPDVDGPEQLSFELTVTDNEGAADTSTVTITIVPAGDVTLSGTVTFDRVPVSSACFPVSTCLDYNATEAAPARNVPIQVIDAANGVTVLASGTTDDIGGYSVVVQNFSDVFVRARAEWLGPSTDVRVVDNTQGDALYVVDGATFNTTGADIQHDVNAPSGWTGNSYGEPRSAAPLAILDAILEAADLVLSADPGAIFPPLEVHWSPANRPVLPADGVKDLDTGEIGTSFYRGGSGGGIFLLGAEGDDTDEYDRHVIAHEFGHYLEDVFSRSDSIGGPHTLGDQLDMRVASGEGWGNAFAAIATADPIYKDAMGPRQGSGFNIDIEGENVAERGWFSESSVHEILYDLYDADVDVVPGTAVTDLVNLGFGPIFDVFVNEQRTTPALTSVFPFIDAIKANNAADAAAIDALLGAQDIEPIIDAFGTTEGNAGSPASADVLPIYTSLTVNGGAEEVCSTDDFSLTFTGATNKLGSRRYLRFQTGVGGTHTFTAVTTSAPPDASTDPDMWLHRAGRFVPGLPSEISDDPPTASCTPSNLGACSETFTFQLGANLDYVLEVYEWTNTNASDDPEFPPIGRACFDVEVTQP
jgi:hypothetical protein